MFERISLSAPDPLLLVDNEGAIRDANDAAAREFQYSRTVLRDLRLADLGDARVDGRFTARYRRADGTHFACEVNAGRVSAQGDVLCILRKLEPRTADDLYAQCFRRGPVAVSIVNMSDNKFVDINDAFLTSTGLAREQVIGKTFIELGIKLTMDAARAVIDRFIETFPERREDTYSVSLVEVMGMAAVDLGARELLPALRALLDTMLLNYSPKQRKAEMASAVEVLGRLAKVKGANATSAATSFKAVRGVALVEQAIVQAKADGTTANPLSAKALAKLTMPNGSPIPASLATWLAFDGSGLDVVKRGALAWKPFPKLMRETYGSDAVPMLALFKRMFPHPCLLLPGGSDSRRFLYAGEPDATGEYPVFVVDIDDVPWVGLCFPGFDVYIAAESGLPIELSGYSASWDGPYGAALAEQSRLNFEGKREHELSAADLNDGSE